MSKSFTRLYRELKKTPDYHSQELAVSFLADLTEAMRALGISNSDLAKRANVSPAYITKVFRGPSNLSLETIAKLAVAAESRANLRLANREHGSIWRNLTSTDRLPDRRNWSALVDGLSAVSAMGCVLSANDEKSNDEKFAVAA